MPGQEHPWKRFVLDDDVRIGLVVLEVDVEKRLKLLDQRGLIRYHPEATNYEYVNQLSNHPLAADFRFQTTVYEYVWYGEFELSYERFQAVHANFLKLHKANSA